MSETRRAKLDGGVSATPAPRTKRSRRWPDTFQRRSRNVVGTTYACRELASEMWYPQRMELQRAITILLPDDADLRATPTACCSVRHAVSQIAFNGGKPLRCRVTMRGLRAGQGHAEQPDGDHDRAPGGWRLRRGHTQFCSARASCGQARGPLCGAGLDVPAASDQARAGAPR